MPTVHTEIASRNSKQTSFFEGILSHIQDPVFVKDIEHRFVFLNDATCDFFGRERENVLHKTDYDFFPKEEADVYRAKDKEVFESGVGNLNIEDFTDASGKKHIISTKKSLFINDLGEKYLVVVIRDITDIKKTEKHLLKSIDQLAEFAYVASHDIKSPLRTIHSFAELLNRKYRKAIPEGAHAYIDFIVTASSRANNLVKDILDYSTSTNVEVDAKPIELNRVIEEIKENITRLIEENQALIQFNNLPTVNGNRVRLYQLFQNLISNSIKFRKEDVSPVITIDCKTMASGYEISVSDNGIGIEPAYLDKVFNLFTKLNTSAQYIGSGIGLATCKKIINQMGGNIHVESEFGKGTTFIIFFPLK